MNDEDLETFKKRSGCTDRGKDYEHLYLASLILKLVIDTKIKNFKLSSNAENYGAFDDVVLEVENTNGTKQIYAIQLKHKGRTLTKAALTGKSGDFSLRKYHEEFTKLESFQHPVKFVLLTNLKFEVSNKTKLTLEGGCDVTVAEESQECLLKTCEKGRCWSFTTSDENYKDFFESFPLYTDQESVDRLKLVTMTQFRQLFASSDEIFEKYLQFVTDWSLQEGKKNKLYKNLMLNVIILKALGPQVKAFSFSGEDVNENDRLFREALLKFQVTSVEENCYEHVKKIWRDLKQTIDVAVFNQANKRYRVVSRYISNVEELSDEDCTKLLWLMGLCPLPVLSGQTFEKIVVLCQNRFILFGNSSSVKNVFRNLSELDAGTKTEVLRTFTCCVQGRDPITLEELIKDHSEIGKIITTKELFQMLDGPFQIGGQKEILPIPHIDRILTRNIISLDFLSRTRAFVFIGQVGEDDEQRIRNSSLDKIIVTRMVDFWKREIHHDDDNACQIFISDTECSDDGIETICRHLNKKDYHHFRMSNGELEWIRSEVVEELNDFRVGGQCIEQNHLFGKPPENRINIVCADPGMGKSIMMKNLKNSSRLWTILIQPKDHSKFFRTKNNNSDDFFEYILNRTYSGFVFELVKILFEDRKVVFIWDGLDEAAQDNLKVILQVIDGLARKGHVQWLTSRCNLKGILEKTFNVLARNIEQFDLKQQNTYIEKRLNCTGDVLEDIKKKIFKCIKLVQYNDILGIPLQIYMFTELFRQNPEKYRTLLSSVFSITDLYRYFVEEKFNIYHLDKADLKDSNDVMVQMMESSKNHRLRQYEEAAIKTYLSPNVLNQLGINCDRFLEEIQNVCDGVGIIIGVTEEKIASFLHNSYGEYFAACYLRKYHQKITGIIDFIFKESFNNIRFLFDLLMAEDRPAHVATLYKNIRVLESHEESLKMKDQAGRNPLHLACSWGKRFSFKSQEKIGQEAEDDAPEYKEILDYLSQRCDPLERDGLFQMDAFQYADRACCILPILLLSNGRRIDFGILRNFNDIDRILYNSVRFDYPEVFEDIPFVTIENEKSLLHLSITHGSVKCLKKMLTNPEYKQRINAVDRNGITPFLYACNTGHLETIDILMAAGADTNATTSEGYSGIFLLARSNFSNILKTLLDGGLDVNMRNNKGETALQMACNNGLLQAAELLLDLGAEVDLGDQFGYTPLHWACRKGNEDIVSLLLERGADVNLANHHGDVPIFIAATNGGLNLVELLMEKGADINRINTRDHGAIHAACMNSGEEILRVLIDAGVDVNVPNKFGQTPLHIAVRNHFDVGVKMLLEAGADVELVNRYGESFWDIGSRRYNRKTFVRMIIEAKGEDYWEWMKKRFDGREEATPSVATPAADTDKKACNIS